jgi:hypothetical protein
MTKNEGSIYYTLSMDDGEDEEGEEDHDLKAINTSHG